MRKERFEELVGSVREAGAVMRGEVKPYKEFHIDEPRTRRNPEKQFAICIKTDDPVLLIPQKIYQVELLGDGLARVIDEEGEASIYSVDHFIFIKLPRDIEKALISAAQ